MEEYRVKSGQSLYDVSIQLYGSTEFVLELVQNNPQLTGGVNSNLESNSTLFYTPQNTTITNFLNVNRLNLATTEPKTVSGSSYGDSYGNSYDIKR